MDTLSPTRICDPWAVHHAKSCAADALILTKTQQKLIDTFGEKLSQE